MNINLQRKHWRTTVYKSLARTNVCTEERRVGETLGEEVVPAREFGTGAEAGRNLGVEKHLHKYTKNHIEALLFLFSI